MKNIELIKPKLDEYDYYQKLLSDPKTMSYNAGYEVSYEGYHYDTGCIDYPKSNWKEKNNDINFFAYIRDTLDKKYVGYVSYNFYDNKYNISILIENKYRGKGYSKDALKLLIKEAYNNKIEYLYDSFEKTRGNTLNIFLDLGFEIYEETTWKKFNRDAEGVVVRIKTDKVLPDLSKVKTVDDVLTFMKDNIRYGWLDINNEFHIGNMKDFRKLYRTLSIDEILKYGVGTCIDQANLIHFLLNKINVKNKMFATRIYEPNDFNDINKEEHMHSFVLCYEKDRVYHIEHPNFYKIGIYEYKNEKEALETINDYYVKLSGGIPRPITEFFEVKPNISFKEFNNYINDLK